MRKVGIVVLSVFCFCSVVFTTTHASKNSPEIGKNLLEIILNQAKKGKVPQQDVGLGSLRDEIISGLGNPAEERTDYIKMQKMMSYKTEGIDIHYRDGKGVHYIEVEDEALLNPISLEDIEDKFGVIQASGSTEPLEEYKKLGVL